MPDANNTNLDQAYRSVAESLEESSEKRVAGLWKRFAHLGRYVPASMVLAFLAFVSWSAIPTIETSLGGMAAFSGNSKIEYFDPSPADESIKPSPGERALVVVHPGYGDYRFNKSSTDPEYVEYLDRLDDLVKEYLSAGDPVVIAMGVDRYQAGDFWQDLGNGDDKGVLLYVTQAAAGFGAPGFSDGEGNAYVQDFYKLTSELKLAGVKDLHVVGEFDELCLRGVFNAFDRTSQFETVEIGSVTFP